MRARVVSATAMSVVAIRSRSIQLPRFGSVSGSSRAWRKVMKITGSSTRVPNTSSKRTYSRTMSVETWRVRPPPAPARCPREASPTIASSASRAAPSDRARLAEPVPNMGEMLRPGEGGSWPARDQPREEREAEGRAEAGQRGGEVERRRIHVDPEVRPPVRAVGREPLVEPEPDQPRADLERAHDRRAEDGGGR